MAAKGIYTALSGAIAQSQRLDSIANNMANANTTGYKRDQNTFREYLTALEKEQSVIKVPKLPATIDSFYDMQGLDQSYVDNNGSYIDFTQGGLTPTGANLDVAIDGAGFFEVQSPEGIVLTRKGHFQINEEGLLTTAEGLPVLASDENGANPEERYIKINGSQGAQFEIAEDGQVYQGDLRLGRLSLVDIQDKNQLRKVGNSLYRVADGVTPQVTSVEKANLRQGYLESSNVNIVQEMTDMIQASRAFETNQKVITAYDNISDKLVNQVPKV